MNHVIHLKSRPKGTPQLEDFEFVEEQKPKPKEGEILLKPKAVSVDPYLRGRMRDQESYIPPFQLNEPIV